MDCTFRLIFLILFGSHEVVMGSSVEFINERSIFFTGQLDFITREKRSSQLVMLRHFTETTVTPGVDVRLHCVASGPSTPQISFVWERDGIALHQDKDPRYTMSRTEAADGSVSIQLNISNVRVDDGGLVGCRAFQAGNRAEHYDRLNVYGPPYIRAKPPIKVQSGQSATLRCPYYGYPISEITWEPKKKEFKLDDIVDSSYSIEIFGRKPKLRTRRDAATFTDDSVLNIAKVGASDNGASYACIVKSPSGEMAMRSFELLVVEPPELEEILLPPNLQEGQMVQIHCSLKSGDPPVYFSWLKDGNMLPPKLKIAEKAYEVFSVLVIKNVTVDHCGTYTCVAVNNVAKTNRTVSLYIKVAPKWKETPRNTSILLGKSAHIACKADGYPQPQTHWLKKDVISDTWRPVLEVAGGGVLSLSNGSLIFDSVALSDDGMYTCHVENGVGEPLSKTIWIFVKKPVTFEVNEINGTVNTGQRAFLECAPIGDHPIRVTWTKGGAPLYRFAERFKITEKKTEEGMISTLELLEVQLYDGGNYECRAENPYGAAVLTAHVRTIISPYTPRLDTLTQGSRKIKLAWSNMAYDSTEYYNVQITKSDRMDWNNPARSVNVSKTESDRIVAEIDGLHPYTNYAARVAGFSQHDRSNYSNIVLWTSSEEAPSSPPMGVQVEPTENPGELRVRWRPPPAEDQNGPILGYHLRAIPQLTGDVYPTQRLVSEDPTSSLYAKEEYILKGLYKGVRYAVSVAAYNNLGIGPFSMPVFQDTREGGPVTYPSSVECSAVSSTGLRVSWQPIPPHQQGGALIGYSVLYAAQGRQWMNTTTPVTEVRLQGLLKFTNYTIKVAGFTSYGTGPYSGLTVVCETMQDVPDAPAEIKLLSQSTTSLLVSWKKPKQPNGRLLHYTVYYKPTSSNDNPKSMKLESPSNTDAYERTLTMEIKGLKNGQQYDVYVTASTIVGEGPASTKVSNTPSQRVVAGVASLNDEVTVPVRNSLLLECKSVGSPPPRTVWYHNQNIITHHPRFTRNRDDSLLIKSIDQALGGNYTCLAKNLYGSDSVVYMVRVLPLPDPPYLRTTPYKDSIGIKWDDIFNNDSTNPIMYNLTWRESAGSWQEDDWPTAQVTLEHGHNQYKMDRLKCGTKYSIRVTATDSVGTSAPAYIDTTTLGGAPIAPTSTDWLWSNATHIYIQLSGWDDGGCDVTKWAVDYRLLGTNLWYSGDNKKALAMKYGWKYDLPDRPFPSSFAVGPLTPASWYQIRVTVTNDAGTATSVYAYATKNMNGEEIGPPSEFIDLNTLVIICSSVLLVVCLTAVVCILVRKHRQNYTAQYRHSIAEDAKSRNESVASHSEQKERYVHAPPRIYTSPLHTRKNGKNEMFEISPYAEFALGFRTFDHVENQDLPSRLPSRPRFDTETSFQTRSESDDSDSTSKATVAVPRRHCRTPHHR